MGRTKPGRQVRGHRPAQGMARGGAEVGLEGHGVRQRLRRRLASRRPALHYGRQGPSRVHRRPQCCRRQTPVVRQGRLAGRARCAGLELPWTTLHPHRQRPPRFCRQCLGPTHLYQRRRRQGAVAQTLRQGFGRQAPDLGLLRITPGGRRSGGRHAGWKERSDGGTGQEAGRLLWQSKDFTDDAQYSSIVPARSAAPANTSNSPPPASLASPPRMAPSCGEPSVMATLRSFPPPLSPGTRFMLPPATAPAATSSTQPRATASFPPSRSMPTRPWPTITAAL